jgi:transcriptional regulator with XRE-family HTH domain
MTGEPIPLQINVRRLRAARGMTLAQLADKVGISISHLSQVERGVKSINSRLLAKFAEVLEVSPGSLVGETEEQGRSKNVVTPQQEDAFVRKLRAMFQADPSITPSSLALKAGLDNSTIRQLLAGKAKSTTVANAEKICAALGTTLSQFISKRSDKEVAPVATEPERHDTKLAGMSADEGGEEQLLSMFRRLTVEEKAAVLRFAQGHFPFD